MISTNLNASTWEHYWSNSNSNSQKYLSSGVVKEIILGHIEKDRKLKKWSSSQ